MRSPAANHSSPAAHLSAGAAAAAPGRSLLGALLLVIALRSPFAAQPSQPTQQQQQQLRRSQLIDRRRPAEKVCGFTKCPLDVKPQFRN